MDFDKAAERLARDQKKIRGRASGRPAPSLSAKAKREAEIRRKQQERLAAERKKKQQQKEALEQFMRRCERNLGVKSLTTSGNPLMLTPTSIHGEGDKIALPVSVLEFLTNAGIEMSPDSPWIFRIGIPNPDYTFPASPLLEKLATDVEEDGDHVMDDEEHNDEPERAMMEAFLDELSHKYIAYTHGSVVEFTQEEGHVGLPATMAAALTEHGGDKVPVHRTVDPAAGSMHGDQESGEEEIEKTPGHLAWGEFDVPDLPVEVSLVKLPKGQACTLQPTKDAILNGFYNLKDIKLVLEQSLIRTRATLSVHDLVHTWHRGVKYDLCVKEVQPATYNAVVCINTDINVDFAAPPASMEDEISTNAETPETGRTLGSAGGTAQLGQALSEGRVLGTATNAPKPASILSTPASDAMNIELRPEPPIEQKSDVCDVQIRGDGATGRRRFDVNQATMNDLFLFARTIVSTPDFQLVSRFPRRVFQAQKGAEMTLAEAGLQQGQELLLVERA